MFIQRNRWCCKETSGWIAVTTRRRYLSISDFHNVQPNQDGVCQTLKKIIQNHLCDLASGIPLFRYIHELAWVYKYGHFYNFSHQVVKSLLNLGVYFVIYKWATTSSQNRDVWFDVPCLEGDPIFTYEKKHCNKTLIGPLVTCCNAKYLSLVNIR